MSYFAKQKISPKWIASTLVNCVLWAFIIVGMAFLIMPIFGLELFVVQTNSMQPNLKIGDAIIINRNKKASVGDVITYKHAQLGQITHRIIAIEGGNYFCVGDGELAKLRYNWQDANIEFLNNKTKIDCKLDIVGKDKIIGVVDCKFNYFGKLILAFFNNKIVIIFYIACVYFFLTKQNGCKNYF